MSAKGGKRLSGLSNRSDPHNSRYLYQGLLQTATSWLSFYTRRHPAPYESPARRIQEFCAASGQAVAWQCGHARAAIQPPSVTMMAAMIVTNDRDAKPTSPNMTVEATGTP